MLRVNVWARNGQVDLHRVAFRGGFRNGGHKHHMSRENVGAEVFQSLYVIRDGLVNRGSELQMPGAQMDLHIGERLRRGEGKVQAV
jgi:hypothetical protein